MQIKDDGPGPQIPKQKVEVEKKKPAVAQPVTRPPAKVFSDVMSGGQRSARNRRAAAMLGGAPPVAIAPSTQQQGVKALSVESSTPTGGKYDNYPLGTLCDAIGKTQRATAALDAEMGQELAAIGSALPPDKMKAFVDAFHQQHPEYADLQEQLGALDRTFFSTDDNGNRSLSENAQALVDGAQFSSANVAYVKSALNLLASSPQGAKDVLAAMPSLKTLSFSGYATTAPYFRGLFSAASATACRGALSDAIKSGSATPGADALKEVRKLIDPLIDVNNPTGLADVLTYTVNGEAKSGAAEVNDLLSVLDQSASGEADKATFLQKLNQYQSSPIAKSFQAFGVALAATNTFAYALDGDLWSSLKNGGYAARDLTELATTTTQIFTGVAKDAAEKFIPFVGAGANIISGYQHVSDFFKQGSPWSVVAATGDLIAVVGNLAAIPFPGVGSAINGLGLAISGFGDFLSLGDKERVTLKGNLETTLGSLRPAWGEYFCNYLENSDPKTLKRLADTGVSAGTFDIIAKNHPSFAELSDSDLDGLKEMIGVVGNADQALLDLPVEVDYSWNRTMSPDQQKDLIKGLKDVHGGSQNAWLASLAEKMRSEQDPIKRAGYRQIYDNVSA